MKKILREVKGITLIALIVTIIVLLILAGVTLSLVAGGDGILGRAENAVNATNEAKAREKLELVLAELMTDKYVDKNYNEDKYIDDRITENEMFVDGDVVTVDGWRFQIDRTKPAIRDAFGKGEEIQNIEITSESQTNETFSQATITYTITYDGNLKSIKINGESLEIPEKTDGKYVLTKTVEKNDTYKIFVTDENGGYKLAEITVNDLADDMEIWTVEQLVAFRDKVNSGATFEGKIVSLMADLDLSSVCSAERGESWIPIANYSEDNTSLVFAGTFNGNNHTISNLYINTTNYYQGLFGYLSETGTIKKLSLEGDIVDSGSFTGGICGYSYGTIENCINRANITQTTKNGCGGIAGYNRGGNIIRCVNTGIITKTVLTEDQGGITGGNVTGRISFCYNTGDIINSSTEDKVALYDIGGIAGSNGMGNGISAEDSIIEECYNIGKVIASNSVRVGGITGWNSQLAQVNNCYNKGIVTGKELVGSIVGSNNTIAAGTITNTFFLSGTASLGIGLGTGGATSKSAEYFTYSATNPNSVTYLLNGNKESGVWAQSSSVNEKYPYLVDNAPEADE